MGEETSDTVNLDWNLSHGPEAQSGSIATEVVNLDDWVDDPIDRIREDAKQYPVCEGGSQLRMSRLCMVVRIAHCLMDTALEIDSMVLLSTSSSRRRSDSSRVLDVDSGHSGTIQTENCRKFGTSCCQGGTQET
ncbi:hypothetical protein CUMW_003600 [Citrus unshiu]|nr:hypothetical protein CUMW_003600 [Citrus unshiu]